MRLTRYSAYTIATLSRIKMKICYISTAFIFCIFLNASCQTTKDVSNKISQIDKTCFLIDNYKNYEVDSIDDAYEFLGHNTDNGGILKGYLKADSIKKIVEWVGLSNKVYVDEYYLENGKLIMMCTTESRYVYHEKLEAMDLSKLVFFSKKKYYFENEVLFRILPNGYKIDSTEEKNAASFLTSVKEYIILLESKRK